MKKCEVEGCEREAVVEVLDHLYSPCPKRADRVVVRVRVRAVCGVHLVEIAEGLVGDVAGVGLRGLEDDKV